MAMYNSKLKVHMLCANCGHYYGSILECKGCAHYSNWKPMTDEDKERMKQGEKLRKNRVAVEVLSSDVSKAFDESLAQGESVTIVRNPIDGSVEIRATHGYITKNLVLRESDLAMADNRENVIQVLTNKLLADVRGEK